MELRSNRVLKRGKIDIDSVSDEKKAKLSSDKQVYAKKGRNEGEIGVCVDNADEELEIVISEDMKNVINTDDKGLFLGSEVLDPVKDSVVSCEEESTERVQAEDENNSVSINSREKKIKPKSNSSHVNSNGEKSVDDEITIINCEDNKEKLAENDDCGISKRVRKKGKSQRGRKKRKMVNSKKNESKKNTEIEIENGVVKRERGRKRKFGKNSENNRNEKAKKVKNEMGEAHVSGRVLRSSGGVEVVDSGVKCAEKGNQLCTRPKKKLERRGRPPKVRKDENTPQTVKQKKLKRRGRPPKVEGESSLPNIVKRRGRPPRVHFETKDSHGNLSGKGKSRGQIRKLPETKRNRHKSSMLKKLTNSIRSKKVKIEAKTLASHVTKMRNFKLMEVQKTKSGVKNVKKGNELSKIRKMEESNEQKDEDSIENSKNTIPEGGKRKSKQLVRDKLLDIIIKAGWKIDRRPRDGRTYQDCVYIEPSGRSHWSITGAYKKLKKKIEGNAADSNELAAYIPIPEEEFGLLFRYVDKVLGYKKKKNRIVKDLSKNKNVKNIKKKKENSKKKTIPKKPSKPRLLPRSSENAKKGNGLLHLEKRNLLTWMINSGIIIENSKIQFGKTRRQKKIFEGTITTNGICCNCCNELMCLSEFVSHAGGKSGQQFDNVYLENGKSIRKCLVESWNKEVDNDNYKIKFNYVDVKGDDPNDDTCNICGDGGDLICCDGCPSTFHQSCLDIQNFPSGDWNCIYCSCKYCRVVSVSTPEVDDSHDELTSEMLSCCLCEEKFHQSCLQETESVNTDSNELAFCGRKCQELYERLQTHLGVKVELEDGFSWTLLQRFDVDQELTIHESQFKVECNSKLAVAFSVMDECFVPIVDERSGTSIIHNVVYNCGSNFRRLNYAGFLTAILAKGDELVTTASIRIHGFRLAEMPFIGTRHMYRRQGMCRRLLDAIESTLATIGVEKLIIPAIPELLQTWTKVFGFVPIEESKKQELKSISMVVFPGVDLLQKPLIQNESTDSAASKAMDHEEKNVEAVEIPKDAIDCEQIEETLIHEEKPDDDNSIIDKNIINCEQNEETNDLIIDPNAIDHEEREKTENTMETENTIETEKAEEATEILNMSSCHEDDKLINSLCDLNIPVKEVTVKVPEASDEIILCEKKEDDPVECGPCELTVVAIVENENDDDISEVKGLTFTKNTFDLNLHPAGVETDVHIISDDSLSLQS